MSAEMVVREATDADEPGIALVADSAVETLRQTYRPTAEIIAHKQAIAHTLTRLVALIDDRVVGTLQYCLKDDRIHFIALSVHADYRRRGVTRRMIEELEKIGRGHGIGKISAYTVTQTGNTPIFERLGFRAISEEPTEFYESDIHARLTETYFERAIEA